MSLLLIVDVYYTMLKMLHIKYPDYGMLQMIANG